jgi:uncharacterized membrane protein YhaH (DUF805 family)
VNEIQTLFAGRVGRRDWLVQNLLLGTLLTLLAYSGTLIPAIGTHDQTHAVVVVLANLFRLPVIALLCASTVRRLHDIRAPWWCLFLFLIPLINIYMLLLLAFKKGSSPSRAHGDRVASL